MISTEFCFSIPLGSELNCSDPSSVQNFLIFTWGQGMSLVYIRKWNLVARKGSKQREDMEVLTCGSSQRTVLMHRIWMSGFQCHCYQLWASEQELSITKPQFPTDLLRWCCSLNADVKSELLQQMWSDRTEHFHWLLQKYCYSIVISGVTLGGNVKIRAGRCLVVMSK